MWPSIYYIISDTFWGHPFIYVIKYGHPFITSSVIDFGVTIDKDDYTFSSYLKLPDFKDTSEVESS